MWNNVITGLTPGQQLLTPGRGIPPTRRRPFFVVDITPKHVDIEIGQTRTFNRLPRRMFDAVDAFFQNNPQRYLRIAAEHSTTPTPNSVDAVVRAAVHFPRAIGNYVAAILEAAGCVRYFMVANKKCIELL